ncbi:MAG TPA: hypothetical protein VEH31_44565 [Streptosporangiaceae bacterium]|nr:hypothetical protein [Streptosporangiaceae bacterium]
MPSASLRTHVRQATEHQWLAYAGRAELAVIRMRAGWWPRGDAVLSS